MRTMFGAEAQTEPKEINTQYQFFNNLQKWIYNLNIE